MATQTEVTQELSQPTVASTELATTTPNLPTKPPKRVVGRPFQPGNNANPKGAGAAKTTQMQQWRERMQELDPVRDKSRLQVIFDTIYEEMHRVDVKGKDVVACAEFLMKRSFGDVADEDLATGAVRIQIIGIPAGSQVAVGVKTPEDQTSPALLTPEFPPDEL